MTAPSRERVEDIKNTLLLYILHNNLCLSNDKKYHQVIKTKANNYYTSTHSLWEVLKFLEEVLKISGEV